MRIGDTVAGPRSALMLSSGLLLLVTAGCSSRSGQTPASGRTLPVPVPASASAAVPEATASAAVSKAPLTDVSAGPAIQARAVVAVPLVVAPRSARPSGLSSADVVFETALGHDGLRLLALFQSGDPAHAGPVSSTIPSDAQVLSVLHPVLANTGGSAGFVKTLHASTVVDASTARAPYGYQAAAKPATSMNAVPSLLRKAAGGQAAAPPPLFTFADGSTVNQSTAAHTVVVTTPGQLPEQWTYVPASRQWSRTGADGVSVSVTNVVLQLVPYDNVLLRHPGKATVPVARVLGTGSATILLSGVAVRATWSKPSSGDITNYTDAGSLPVWLNSGTTWVSLLSTTSRVTVR